MHNHSQTGIQPAALALHAVRSSTNARLGGHRPDRLHASACRTAREKPRVYDNEGTANKAPLTPSQVKDTAPSSAACAVDSVTYGPHPARRGCAHWRACLIRAWHLCGPHLHAPRACARVIAPQAQTCCSTSAVTVAARSTLQEAQGVKVSRQSWEADRLGVGENAARRV